MCVDIYAFFFFVRAGAVHGGGAGALPAADARGPGGRGRAVTEDRGLGTARSDVYSFDSGSGEQMKGI